MFKRGKITTRNIDGRSIEQKTSSPGTGCISADLDENLLQMREILADFSDLVIKTFKIGGKQRAAAVVYIDGLTDTTVLYNFVLSPLMLEVPLDEEPGGLAAGSLLRYIKKNVLLPGQLSETTSIDKLIDAVLAGSAVLFLDGTPAALISDIRGWEARSRGVKESPSEAVVQGPREAFNETLRTNTSLLRRRIRSPHLKIEVLTLGRQTKTEVAVIYMQDLDWWRR